MSRNLLPSTKVKPSLSCGRLQAAARLLSITTRQRWQEPHSSASRDGLMAQLVYRVLGFLSVVLPQPPEGS
jgi:hypothetical protein